MLWFERLLLLLCNEYHWEVSITYKFVSFELRAKKAGVISTEDPLYASGHTLFEACNQLVNEIGQYEQRISDNSRRRINIMEDLMHTAMLNDEDRRDPHGKIHLEKNG